jgi:hypothetical protein
MKRRSPSPFRLAMATLPLLILTARADSRFSPERLNQLDKLGAFPPEFKKAVHDYVNVKQALVDTANEEKKLRAQLPVLAQQTVAAQAKLDGLQQQLLEYNHTDESDFTLLQKKMNDAQAKPEEQLQLAQVFVWSYPTSPHQPQAQLFLQQVQKVIADRLQAEKDAEAASAAARALLLQRVQARALSLDEWKAFLANMVETDVIKYLGPPPQQNGYYWIYPEPWALVPDDNQKVGLRINFNGGRVVGVAGEAVTPIETDKAVASPD